MFMRHCCSLFFLKEKEYLLYSKSNGNIIITSWCDLGAVGFSSGLILFFFFYSSVFSWTFKIQFWQYLSVRCTAGWHKEMLSVFLLHKLTPVSP